MGFYVYVHLEEYPKTLFFDFDSEMLAFEKLAPKDIIPIPPLLGFLSHKPLHKFQNRRRGIFIFYLFVIYQFPVIKRVNRCSQ